MRDFFYVNLMFFSVKIKCITIKMFTKHSFHFVFSVFCLHILIHITLIKEAEKAKKKIMLNSFAFLFFHFGSLFHSIFFGLNIFATKKLFSRNNAPRCQSQLLFFFVISFSLIFFLLREFCFPNSILSLLCDVDIFTQ